MLTFVCFFQAHDKYIFFSSCKGNFFFSIDIKLTFYIFFLFIFLGGEGTSLMILITMIIYLSSFFFVGKLEGILSKYNISKGWLWWWIYVTKKKRSVSWLQGGTFWGFFCVLKGGSCQRWILFFCLFFLSYFITKKTDVN